MLYIIIITMCQVIYHYLHVYNVPPILDASPNNLKQLPFQKAPSIEELPLESNDYVLSGRKDFVTNAPIADFIAVLAEAKDGHMVAVVEPRSRGVVIEERLKTLGYDGLAVAAVSFKSVRVPGRLVLGSFTDRKHIEFLTQIQ